MMVLEGPSGPGRCAGSPCPSEGTRHPCLWVCPYTWCQATCDAGAPGRLSWFGA